MWDVLGLTRLSRSWYDRPLRRLLTVLFAAAVLAPVAAADAPRFFRNHFTYTEEIRGICAFPIVRSADEEHTRILQYDDLPTGLHPSLNVIYQQWGKHFVRYDDVWSNPVTGRSISARGAGPLNRTDFDVHFTIGPDGWFTTEDQYAGTYIGTAPGEGVLFSFSGTTRYHHTSVIVDGRRVSRSDVLYFERGPSGFSDRFCAYLAGL